MMPKVSPNSSSKKGPTTPWGSVCRMSPMLLRTWYQVSSTSRPVVAPSRLTKMVVTPGRVKLRMKSRCGVSSRVRSSRSVTWSIVSSMVAPGQTAFTTMVRTVKGGSSARPSRKKELAPASEAASIR